MMKKDSKYQKEIIINISRPLKKQQQKCNNENTHRKSRAVCRKIEKCMMKNVRLFLVLWGKKKKQKQIIYLLGWSFSFLRKESHFPANFFCFLIYSLFIFLQTTNCFNIFLHFVCLCTACFETKEAERQQICKIQEEKLSSSSLVKENMKLEFYEY